jgi:hypothetical protein
MSYKHLPVTMLLILVCGCSSQVGTSRLANRIDNNPILTKEEKQFAKRQIQVWLRVLEDNKDQAKAIYDSPNFQFPSEFLNSDIFRKWGFTPTEPLTLEEKYYLSQISQLDDTWKRVSTIDLDKLSPEESRFLKDMHKEYGSGRINFRQKTREKQGSLTQQQEMWFDLIKASTGDDNLDDKGLVILYRLTPR